MARAALGDAPACSVVLLEPHPSHMFYIIYQIFCHCDLGFCWPFLYTQHLLRVRATKERDPCSSDGLFHFFSPSAFLMALLFLNGIEVGAPGADCKSH